MQYKELTIYTDGGARGNPGPAAIGVIIYNEAKKPILKVSRAIGIASNNEAEYKALIEALTQAVSFGKKTEITMYSDSELMVSQLNGHYKIKVPKLQDLSSQVWDLIKNFKKVIFVHVKREQNEEADELVNSALDGHPINFIVGNVSAPKLPGLDSNKIPEHAVKVFSGILYDVYQWEKEQEDGTSQMHEDIVKKD